MSVALLVLLALGGLLGAARYWVIRGRRRDAPISSDSEERVRGLRYLLAVLNQAFDAVEQGLRPGVTPQALAALMENVAQRAGVRSSVRNFRGFPEAAAISVNNTFLNGVPSHNQIREGDVVHIQFGVTDGRGYAHQAWAYEIGIAGAGWQTVISAARRGLENAASAARAGGRVGDVSHAIQSAADEGRCQPNREYGGCGIWDQPFGWPPIPCWPDPKKVRVRLPANRAVLVQSILHAGSSNVTVQADHWGVNSADGLPAVALSQMLFLAPTGTEVLTPLRRTRIEPVVGPL